MSSAATAWPGTTTERDRRRAWLVGVTSWPGIEATPQARSSWLDDLREWTPRRDRWLWASRWLKHERQKGEPDLTEARAAYFGEFVLEEWAAGRNLALWSRFADRAERHDEWSESWLWDADCLRQDGWHQVQAKTPARDGKPATTSEAWTKATSEAGAA